MLKFIPFILFLLTSFLGSAQTVLQGRIKDGKGKGVGGASIAIKDSYDGATTDSLGNYRFRSTEKGEHTLVITCIGYNVYEQKIILSGGEQKLDAILKAAPNELTAVVITAGTFEASDTKRATVLGPIDIVTTAGSDGDITNALKTLPGAQQVGEKEGLFVRGGSAEEAKVFIDGTLVNNYFQSSVPDIASRGRFSPFIFKGTVFSTGGYSALYGGALSSALILESIDLPEQTSANIGVSPIFLSGGYNHLAKDKKSSWGANYGYTNLAAYFAIIKQRPDNFLTPEFHNGDVNFRIKTSKTGILKFYGYFNYSQLGLRRPDIDSTLLKNAFTLYNFNVYTNLSWKEKIGKRWRLNLGASYSNNIDKIRNVLQDQDNKESFIDEIPFNSKSFSIKNHSDLSQIKLVLERRLYGLSAIRFGGEYLYFTDKTDFSNRYVLHAKTTADDHFKAGFAEADIYITNDLAAKLGGRFEHSSLLNRANIVPRASLAYKLGNQAQVSMAYGIFYQRPEKEFFLRNYAQTDDLLYTKATHYIVNYQRISRNYTLRIEAFYKKYDELVKTYATKGNLVPDSVANGGSGKAQGIELFWRDRKTFKDVDYWISYSYLDTKRDYLNYPFAIQPSFAAKHTASLVVKKFITKIKTSLNASYSFATGRPYYNFRYNAGDGKFVIADKGRTIAYNNLSLSVNYLPGIGKKDAKRFTVWVFSLNNVLGSDQVFGYNYSWNGNRKEPILPTARRFFFVGCFISFGIDRSEDVINNNL